MENSKRQTMRILVLFSIVSFLSIIIQPDERITTEAAASTSITRTRRRRRRFFIPKFPSVLSSSSSTIAGSSSDPCHTTFKFKFRSNAFPTHEDANALFNTHHPLRYNHNFVGITNPSLQDTINANEEVVASPDDDDDVDSFWIPDGTKSVNEELSKQNMKPLRIIRHRKLVGQGEECYSKLRDVALGWEGMHKNSNWAGIRMVNKEHNSNRDYFNTHHVDGQQEDNNIIESSDTTTNIRIKRINEDPFAPLPETISQNVMQIFSSGGRKLVTFSKLFGGKIPFLWALNPCCVVYDLVDARAVSRAGGGGLKYSSTAYGTLRGHLISGEERVTVAIRDNGGRGSISSRGSELDRIFFTGSQFDTRTRTATLSSNGVDSSMNTMTYAFGENTSDIGGDVYVEILSCSRPSPGLLGRLTFPLIKNMQDRFFQEQIDTLANIAEDLRRNSERNTGLMK